jgi:hypothetical protein
LRKQERVDELLCPAKNWLEEAKNKPKFLVLLAKSCQRQGLDAKRAVFIGQYYNGARLRFAFLF